MKRRDLIVRAFGSLGTVLITRASRAQSKSLPVVGYLAHGFGPSTLDNAFLDGLRKEGLVAGQTVHIEFRFSRGDGERLREFARELVARSVNVIVTPGPLATRAAREATRDIPIVMLVADPVGSGFVTELARPDANITGRSFLGTELNVKRLELLREALPGLVRLAVLFNGANLGSTNQLRTAELAAAKQGLQVLSVDIGPGGPLEQAMIAGVQRGAQAGIVLSQGQNVSPGDHIGSATIRSGLPTMFASVDYVRVGGLISYGANLAEVYKQAATHVDRVLRGAKPSDLPVEAPTVFELAVNLRTARALGIQLPASLLAQADEVIE